MNIQPKVAFRKHSNPFRERLREVVTHEYFELFILVCIVLNTIVLAINWYDQPRYLDSVLSFINYSFAGIFAIEAILKLYSLGLKPYFNDKGNVFDFVIVIASILSSIVSVVLKFDFGASATFIRALRL